MGVKELKIEEEDDYEIGLKETLSTEGANNASASCTGHVLLLKNCEEIALPVYSSSEDINAPEGVNVPNYSNVTPI